MVLIINPTLANELAEAALICDNDTSIRCVILTGNGRMFCAGGSSSYFLSQSPFYFYL